MEQYYAAHSFVYPDCTGSSCGALAPYMSDKVTVPTDPLNGAVINGITYSYVYSYGVSKADYTVTACLEKAANCDVGNSLIVNNLQ